MTHDYQYITGDMCQRRQIIEMEAQILSKISFDISKFPTTVQFLDSFVLASHIFKDGRFETEKVYHLSRYLTELSLIECKMLKYSPSMVAAGALCLSLKLLKVKFTWDAEISKITSYKKEDLVKCAQDMVTLLIGIRKCSLKAIKVKFGQKCFSSISNEEFEGLTVKKD